MTIELQPSWLLSTASGPGLLEHPVGRMLLVSLALHLALMLALVTVRISPGVPRPSGSYQVTLVSLPPVKPEAAPPQSPAEKPISQPVPTKPAPPPAAVAPKPVPAVPPVPPPTPTVVPPAPPKPPPIAKLQPIPLPFASSGPSSTSSQNLVKDALKGIELPPEAPRMAEAAAAPVQPPPPTPTPEHQDLDARIRQLSVPDTKTIPSPVAPVERASAPMSRRSVREELEKLEQELKTAPPPPVKPETQPAGTASAPSRSTALTVEGLKTGPNSYFGRVQSLIGQHWAPPPVILSGEMPTVVIRFRLHRTGGVSDLSVERSSGNDYYDAAGKRAILSAFPLPPFPAELQQPYVDITFSFGVTRNPG